MERSANATIIQVLLQYNIIDKLYRLRICTIMLNLTAIKWKHGHTTTKAAAAVSQTKVFDRYDLPKNVFDVMIQCCNQMETTFDESIPCIS